MTDLIKNSAPAEGAQNEEQGATFLARFAAMAMLAFVVMVPEQAHAAAAAPWDNIVATITGIFTGGLARAIAILVVIGLGIAAFFGKLTWKLAGGFIGGIVLIFGAAAIADFFIAGV